MNHLKECIRQGRGEEPADKVLSGGRIFDLITGDLIEGDVAICGQTIVGVAANYVGKEVIDVTDLTLVPGFIDTHLHIESSLLTPFEFDRCVAPRGITTAICDPHELANVIGVEGIRWFQEASTHMTMDLKVQLSSCVPSTNMETSGARINASDLKSLLDHPSVIGLAEFMNYPGVIHQDPDVMAKLELFQDGHIDGHCPQLTGFDLNAYIVAGIRTEHEATTEAEAREKLQKGLRVLIREGSVSKDLIALQPLLSERTSSYMCLCTDDRNPLDIDEYGHLDFMIRELIARGTPPLAAYRAASLSGAEAFGLKDRGLIAPGLRADIVALRDLTTCDVDSVFCAGQLVEEAAFADAKTLPVIGRHTVTVPTLGERDFHIVEPDAETPVIGIIEGKIITDYLIENIMPTEGDKRPDPVRDLARVSVIERHGKNGNIGNGFVSGFSLRAGAIASTVCHDHHNIVCVGSNYSDMLIAVNRLGETDGGFVVVEDERVLAELPLPIAGLMSDQPFEVVRAQLQDLREAAKSLGVKLKEPFLQLAFLALPVIPALKITDYGMVDVTQFKLLN